MANDIPKLTPGKGKFEIKEYSDGLKIFKKLIPVKLGNMAVNHFKKSFRDGGFTDISLVKWPGRKPGAPRNQGRAILVDKGHLRRSVKVKSANEEKIIISSDLPYAAVHNQGLRAGRGRGFRMKKRKFMGNSKTLTRNIATRLKNEINKKIFKL